MKELRRTFRAAETPFSLFQVCVWVFSPVTELTGSLDTTEPEDLLFWGLKVLTALIWV